MSKAHVVDGSLVTFTENHGYAEASELGINPGEFPLRITIEQLGIDLILVDVSADEFTYRQLEKRNKFGSIELTVYND